MISVSRSIGRHVVDLNQRITREIVANPYVERFGRQRTSPKGSIIVCLYGKPEYLFLQAALFSGGRGIEDYQFIFVSNSPELTESLLKEARICAMTFDIDITIVALPGNAGFVAANNAAAKLARSNRLLIVNPDVFPYDKDWAAKHSSLVETLPAEQTRLFGAPLFYDDGSLMHSGLYFDADVGVSLARSTFTQQTFLRVNTTERARRQARRSSCARGPCPRSPALSSHARGPGSRSSTAFARTMFSVTMRTPTCASEASRPGPQPGFMI